MFFVCCVSVGEFEMIFFVIRFCFGIVGIGCFFLLWGVLFIKSLLLDRKFIFGWLRFFCVDVVFLFLGGEYLKGLLFGLLLDKRFIFGWLNFFCVDVIFFFLGDGFWKGLLFILFFELLSLGW